MSRTPDRRFADLARQILKEDSVMACSRAYVALQDALIACTVAYKACKAEGNIEHSHQWETLRDTLIILIDCEASDAYEAIADETRTMIHEKLKEAYDGEGKG